MGRLFGILIVGPIVSGYFYSFSFTFLPEAVNTKMMLAAASVPIFFIRNIRDRQLTISKGLFGATLLAALFSLACLISIDYNATTDYSYVSYIVSFFTWIGGAYTACAAIRWMHGKVSIKTITAYLAAISAFQCVISIIIDQVPAVQQIVDSVVAQGTQYLHEINRLYGIGASLDSAGTRFSVVLILIASVLTQDEKIKSNKKQIWLFLIAFIIIGAVGNMISRTTSAGLLIGLVIFALSSGIHRLIISRRNARLYGILVLSFILAIGIFAYLYNTDSYFHQQLRFGFEGLFNWLETGVWRTDSTDKLSAVMWVWPTDTKTWLIGSGLYGNFVYSTDIGYCRFILYCGLIGFSVFAFFFIYNAYIFASQHQKYRLMFLALLVLTFVIWLKVSTDIFLIYALFYCIKSTDSTFETNKTAMAT